MDGGEPFMTKIFTAAAAAIMLLSALCFTSFAAGTDDESGIEYYEEYDNYDEFEQDYYDSVVLNNELDELPWYERFSLIPPAAGVLAGAATVLVLGIKHREAGRHSAEHSYAYTPEISHSIDTPQNENTL